jgi:hypothetical protein
MGAVNFRTMPRSLNGDELPFVIGFAPDGRQELVDNDIGFRRGDDRFTIEHIVGGDFRVRALGWNLEGTVYVVASAGPLLEEWWPLLKASPADSTRPVLSAAAATGNVRLAGLGTEIEVSLLPITEGAETNVLAVYGIGKGQSFSDENVALCTQLSMPVIKTALLAVSEYPTLVDEVPDVNISQGDVLAPLATVLELSREMASLIPWQHKP